MKTIFLYDVLIGLLLLELAKLPNAHQYNYFLMCQCTKQDFCDAASFLNIIR